jgi:hypothetical protein
MPVGGGARNLARFVATWVMLAIADSDVLFAHA